MVLQRIKTGLDAEEGKAREAFDAMQQETLGTQVQKWYFRMVGEGAGQSFHEQMSDSGTFANPLTLVTGKANYGADTIKFAEGKTKVTDAEKEKLRGWARNMAENAERGLEFRLRVTGYASGEGVGTKARAKKNAQETAQKRADSVVEALEELGVAAEQIVSDTGVRREDWTAEQARCVKLKLIHG
jgi:outer membrane protein OmpA-like peptidoglycan-associated protein